MDSVKKLEKLIILLRDKKSLLSEMVMLTKEQSSSISEEGVDTLTRLISEKGNLIEKIDKLDNEFQSSYDSLKEELGVDSLEMSGLLPRKLLAELKAETKVIMDMINEISEIDRVNRKNAEELKDKLASEIKKINISKQTTGAYYKKPYVQASYYIDSKK